MHYRCLNCSICTKIGQFCPKCIQEQVIQEFDKVIDEQISFLELVCPEMGEKVRKNENAELRRRQLNVFSVN